MSPSATTIETIAISSGISPATTAPKTSSRMISAAGSPNWSSPFSRSSCESGLKSWSSVCVARHGDREGGVLARLLDALDRRPRPRPRRRARAGRSSRAGPPRRARPRVVEVGLGLRERRELARRRRTRRRTPGTPASRPCSSSERMTTMSLDGRRRDRGGNAANRTSSARSDSGLFVGAPSVVRLPPRSSRDRGDREHGHGDPRADRAPRMAGARAGERPRRAGSWADLRPMSGEGRGEPGGSPRFQEEGGSWGKHGFPHDREPKASGAHAASACRHEPLGLGRGDFGRLPHARDEEARSPRRQPTDDRADPERRHEPSVKVAGVS